jgi:hypothetical protein
MKPTHNRRLGHPRTAFGLAALAAAAPVAMLVTAAPAGAVDTPLQTGCPATGQVDGKTVGSQTLSVTDLLAQGYVHPRDVDVNGDGVICGVPLPESAAEQFCGGPCAVPVLYFFSDNELTPYH